MLALHERDRRALERRFAGAVHRRHAAPRDAPAQAQHVDIAGRVVPHPRGQHVVLPRRGGELVAVELLDDRGKAFDAVHLVLGCDVLPVQKEAHEVGRGDRLDLGAQAADRVAVDAREEPAVAPFERFRYLRSRLLGRRHRVSLHPERRLGPGREVSAQHAPFGFQREQAPSTSERSASSFLRTPESIVTLPDVGCRIESGMTEGLRQVPRRHRPQHFQPPAHELARGVFRVQRLAQTLWDIGATGCGATAFSSSKRSIATQKGPLRTARPAANELVHERVPVRLRQARGDFLLADEAGEQSASCSSSAVDAIGHASSRTRSIAAASSAPRSSALRGSLERRV